MRINTVIFALLGIVLLGCGSSKSVYKLSDTKQKGLTYQVYQESPSETFDVVQKVINQSGDKKLMSEGWQISSADPESQTIVTEWMKTGGAQSAGGGRVMGSKKTDRYKLEIQISEAKNGTRVEFKLKNQHRFTRELNEQGGAEELGDWKEMKVKKRDATKLIQPLLEQISEQGLSVQSSG